MINIRHRIHRIACSFVGTSGKLDILENCYSLDNSFVSDHPGYLYTLRPDI